jgi:Phosphoserine phosphatase RsbU, N-terminal domain
MTGQSFTEGYSDELRRYVTERTERQLKTAYELGRRAVQSNLTVLDVASAHTQAVHAIAETCDRDNLVDVIDAAGDFLVESLAAFEMVRRGVTEARRVAFEQRRRARMLRELSSVLADASFVFAAPESIQEMAQLIAEITREVTGAAQARVVLHTPWPSRGVIATAEEPEDDTWSEVLQPLRDVVASPGETTPPEVVKETLRTLDGHPVGFLQVSSSPEYSFAEDDRATVTQVAQMTAGWLDRAHRQDL